MAKRSQVDKLVDDCFLPTASKEAVMSHLILIAPKPFSAKEKVWLKKITKGLDFNSLHYGEEDTMAKAAKKTPAQANHVARGVWHEVKERRRIYYWSASDFLEISEVTKIKVSSSGTHYVTCKDCSNTANIRHIIVAPGWRYVKLEMEDWTF